MNSRAVLINVVLAIAYAATGAATLRFGQTLGPDLANVLWLSSGIALAVALRTNVPVWPGVAVGAMVATWSANSPMAHVLMTGVANGGEIALGVGLLRNAGFDRRFGRVRDVVLFVGLACGLAAALAALVSVASLVATGGAPASALGRIWAMWWLTHGIGMLVVVPLALIVWARGEAQTRASFGEAAALIIGLVTVSWTAFLAPPASLRAELFFLPFPLLLLSAVRGDALVATVGGLLTTILAIVGALTLRGPFSTGTPNEALFLTWSFAAVTIVATVIATAVVRERALAQRKVEKGERRLRAVLEATSEGILVADGVGHITDVNSAFLSLITNPDHPVPPNAGGVEEFLERLRPVTGDGTPMLPAVLDAHVREDRTIRDELHLGSGRVIEAESVPLPDPADESGRVWSVRDVTQRVASEDERRRLHEQILHSQKLEGLGVLAGGVAHDFNNVLAGIMGYAELLLAQPGLDPDGRADAEGIVKAAQHAAGLCGQLLTYAGKTTAVLAPVDLTECARDMQHFMTLSISKNVELSLQLPETPVFAVADEVQVRQVIFNLVTNASEAILERSGSGRVMVRVGTRRCDRSWLDQAYAPESLPEGVYAFVEIEDDGVGMDPETVSQIFDPFYSSKGPGRGLGLSAVLGVLRSHQGALVVESEAGSGTRFQFALPQSGKRVAPARTMSRRSPSEGPATILVVDDEPVVRETVARMIRKDGHEVLQASDGDEALDVLEERGGAIDLMVLDLTMPRRDGLATLSEMRARGYAVPVLLASGYSGEAVPPDAGITGFIQKPFRAAELRDRVAEALAEGVARPP